MRLLRHRIHQNPQILLRPVFIIGLLLFIAALSFGGSLQQTLLALLIPAGVAVVLALLRWPSLGLALASVVGLVVHYSGPSGLNATMILLALLLGLWLFDMVVMQGQIQIAPSRTLWPLLSLIIIALVSFGMGQLPWLTFALHAPLGAQLGGLSVIVLSAGIFILMGNQVRDLRWLQRITWVFLVVGGLSLLFRSVIPTMGIQLPSIFRQVGTVFYICLVSLAFSQAAFNEELHPGWRVALGGLVLTTLYVLFVLKFADKSGWLSAFVCIVAIITARSWRAGLVAIPLAVIGVLLLWSGIVSTDEYSISTRFDAWVIMGQIIKISPILGLGFANYYWYTPLFPIRGYAVSFNSHNNYLDIVAQMGVVGLICLFWFFWEVGRLGWRLRLDVPAGFARAYVYGALGILAGMVVAGVFGDWILPFFYNIGLNGFRSSVVGWLFLGGLASMEQILLRQNPPTAPK